MGLISSTQGQGLYDLMLKGLYKETVSTIKVDSLKEVMEKKNPLLLDTRSTREFEVSHIPGARHVDYENFEAQMVDDVSKDRPVVVYCSVGYRSERIGEKLQSLGFENVSNLYGGIFEWVNKENAIIDDQGAKTDSVHAYNKMWGIWLKKGVKVYE